MKKVVIFEDIEVGEIEELCESISETTECLVNNSGEYQLAHEIDVSNDEIKTKLKAGHTIEVDETMAVWIAKMCNAEIDKTDEMIRMENIWALGSNTVEQSEVHVANMMRLEHYKTMLNDIKEIYCVGV
jgi:hypothetical protein